jgi:hypothetical protein
MKYDVYIGDKFLTSGEAYDLSSDINRIGFENPNYYHHLTLTGDFLTAAVLAKCKSYEGDKALIIEISGAKAELEEVIENGLNIRMLNSEFKKLRKETEETE